MNRDLIMRAKDFYLNDLKSNLSDYNDVESRMFSRLKQLDKICDRLIYNFNSDKIIFIETGSGNNYLDGCLSVFFAFIVNETNGVYYTVDIIPEYVEKNRQIISKLFPNIEAYYHVGDSVRFLNNLNERPNLVHLDSWDLNLLNPFPSALHGWKEFEAIMYKTQLGSLIFVDDNYKKGSWVDWRTFNGDGDIIAVDRIDINYPVVGKGSNVWDYCMESEDWEIIDDSDVGDNFKVTVKKIK